MTGKKYPYSTPQEKKLFQPHQQTDKHTHISHTVVKKTQHSTFKPEQKQHNSLLIYVILKTMIMRMNFASKYIRLRFHKKGEQWNIQIFIIVPD